MRDTLSDAAEIIRTGNDRKLAVTAYVDGIIIITIAKNAYKELPKKNDGKKRKIGLTINEKISHYTIVTKRNMILGYEKL